MRKQREKKYHKFNNGRHDDNEQMKVAEKKKKRTKKRFFFVKHNNNSSNINFIVFCDVLTMKSALFSGILIWKRLFAIQCERERRIVQNACVFSFSMLKTRLI